MLKIRNLILPLVLCFVGGVSQAKIPLFMEVDPGTVYRGGQPENSNDYNSLVNHYNIKAIINLRLTSDEEVDQERSIARQLGVKFISIPIDAKADEVPQRDIDRALKELRTSGNLPVFIHCHLGKDRTGMMMGIYRVKYQEWAADDAFKEMLKLGFSRYLHGLETAFWENAN